ncbi:MAG: BcpO-related WXXGXW repeat protein [Chlorobiaceae bacterium]|jgi:hypothetical protein|nr:BcpO-related WXXGXW repeat protein [Chlorobiaceae bacterium]
MKKSILMVTGIAGILLGTPVTDALAERWDGPGRPAHGIVIDTRPDFIFLTKPGFYVSFNGPFDIIFYGNRYYVLRDGSWYAASHHRGPWVVVRNNALPSRIKRYQWEDLRRYREREYNRHDRRYWDNRFEHDRMRWGRDDRRGHGPIGGPVPPPPPPAGGPGPGGPHGNPGPGGPR